ncbi:MAG TPA: ABC transporter permease [Peptococcaceae bacterium]|nr:ABC transporter permease [Peptococcaceae bacterium]
MAFDSARYILLQALQSLKRNIWLSLASVLTVTISLILLGSAVLFLANTAQVAKTFESQLEIAVFLEKDYSREQLSDLQKQLERMEGVASVVLTTREQAVWQFEETMGSDSLLEDLGGINPFPDKFTITATDATLVEGIANKIMAIEGVSKVRYGQGILEKLINFTHWLRWVGITVVAAFSFASLLLISLSIKTNVNSRAKEIQIMRLVGASNAFIRWPFLIEGLIIGLTGALVAILVVGLGYSWLLQYIVTTLAFIPVVANQQFIINVLLLMLLSGMAMGAVASLLSVRAYLKF